MLPYFTPPEGGWGGDGGFETRHTNRWHCQATHYVDGARDPNDAMDRALRHAHGGTVTILEDDGTTTQYNLHRTQWWTPGTLIVWRKMALWHVSKFKPFGIVESEHPKTLKGNPLPFHADPIEAERILEIFYTNHPAWPKNIKIYVPDPAQSAAFRGL